MKRNRRVIIPRKAPKMLELCKMIVSKHKEMGERSPLDGAVNMQEMEQLFTDALAAYNEAEKLSRDIEAAYEKRNRLLGLLRDQNSTTPSTLLYYMVSVRDVLLGAYKGNERQLGSFGFEVNSSLTASEEGIE